MIIDRSREEIPVPVADVFSIGVEVEGDDGVRGEVVDEEGEVLADGFVDEEAGVAEGLHPVEGVVVTVVMVNWGA